MLPEVLEDRRLLSATMDSNGTLTAMGTNGDDTITMTVVNGALKVTDNGKTTSFALNKVKKIYADAQNDADVLRLDETVKIPATLIAGVGEDFNANQEDFLSGGTGTDQGKKDPGDESTGVEIFLG